MARRIKRLKEIREAIEKGEMSVEQLLAANEKVSGMMTDPNAPVGHMVEVKADTVILPPELRGEGGAIGGGPGAGPGGGGGGPAPAAKTEAKKAPPPPSKAPPPPGGKKGPPGAKGGKKGPPPKKKAAAAAGGKGGKRFRKMPWEVIEDDKGTQFPEIRNIPVEVVQTQVEEDFSLDQKKTDEGGAEKEKKAKKKEVVKLLPDAKRAYTMSIAIARIIKMGFPELKRVVQSLDPKVLDTDMASTLIEYAPKPEEIAAVDAFVDAGGNIADCDTPEQYVYALKDVKNLTQKLTAHRFALTFNSDLDELTVPVEKVKAACQALKDSKRLPRFLFLVTRIGNIVNESDVGGIKLSTIPRLAEYKTSTRPVKNLLQYMVGIIYNTEARDELNMIDELRPCADANKIDLAGIEQRIQGLQGQLKTTSAQVEKLSGEDPIVEAALLPFTKAAAGEMKKLMDNLKETKDAFEDVATYYGEDAESLKKIAVNTYLSYPVKLARELQMIVKDLEDKAAREAKRAALKNKAGGKAAPKAVKAKADAERPPDTSLRTTEDVDVAISK